MNWYYFEKTKYLGLKIPVKIHFRRNIMSQKKAINNWKRAEYLLIKNRKKQQQNIIDHIEKQEQPEHRMVQKFNLDFLKEHGFFLTKIAEKKTEKLFDSWQFRRSPQERSQSLKIL